jgi:hypothetical protein
VIFATSLIIAIYLHCAKPPEDYFVRKALRFLIWALITRLLMSTSFTMSEMSEARKHEPLTNNTDTIVNLS